MTTEEKREELRERIEAAEERNEKRNELAERAIEARDQAVGFAKEHPVAVVAGGVVLGLVIGALTPKGRLLGKRAGKWVAMAAELGTIYAADMIAKAGDAALAGKDRLEDFGDSAAAAARTASRDIGYKAGTAADTAKAIGKRVSRKTGRTMRDLKDRVTH